jgi:RNA polymerase sigma-70 factor (ECF subfamily)
MTGEVPVRPKDDTTHTATIERIPDPALPEFGAEWDAAWEKNLLRQAMEHIRRRIDERQFQAFDLYVAKGWPPGEVAETLGISVARVYLIKHRVAALLKKEVQRLEKAAEQLLRGQASK